LTPCSRSRRSQRSGQVSAFVGRYALSTEREIARYTSRTLGERRLIERQEVTDSYGPAPRRRYAVSMTRGGEPSTSRPSAKAMNCPSCGAEAAVPIAYGMPDDELAQEAEAGLVVLGGCVLSDDSPALHCAECGHDWR
jgi:hypothetical protein